MKNILKWTTVSFALSFFVVLGFAPSASAFTVTDGLHVQSVSYLGGSILNPQGSLALNDNLDIRGYLHNETGQIVIQDDLVINGKIISNLQQEYGGVTDYRGTVFNSTADFTVGDNMMVDGYIWRRAGDIKLFDGVMVQGDLYPYENNKFNLGTTSKKWENIYTQNLSAADLMFTNQVKGPNASFTNDVLIGDDLTVEGLSTLNGGITADSGVFTVADTTGNVYSGGTLQVAGDTEMASNLTLGGVADVQTNLYNSTGSLLVNDNLEIWGLTDFQGSIANSMDDLTVNDDVIIVGTLDLQDTLFNSTDDDMYIGDSLLSNGGTDVQRYIGNSSNPWNQLWLDGPVVIRSGSGVTERNAQYGSGFGYVQNVNTNEATSYTTQNYMVDDGDLGTNTSTLFANRLEVTDGTNTSTYGINTDIQGNLANSTGLLTIADGINQTGAGNQVTLNGNVDATNGLDITGDLTLSGAISDYNSTNLTINDGLIVTGNSDLRGNAYLGNNDGDTVEIGGGTNDNIAITDGQWSISDVGAADFDLLTVDNINIDTNAITSISGTISFDNETLTGTGNITGFNSVSATTLQGTTITATTVQANTFTANTSVDDNVIINAAPGTTGTIDIGTGTATGAITIGSFTNTSAINIEGQAINIHNTNPGAGVINIAQDGDADTINIGDAIDTTSIFGSTIQVGSPAGDTINIGGVGNDSINLGGGGADTLIVNTTLNMGTNNITNANNVTASGTIQGGTVTATTLTDTTATLTGGSLSGVVDITASGDVNFSGASSLRIPISTASATTADNTTSPSETCDSTLTGAIIMVDDTDGAGAWQWMCEQTGAATYGWYRVQ